jgi:hypothetical protein
LRLFYAPVNLTIFNFFHLSFGFLQSGTVK